VGDRFTFTKESPLNLLNSATETDVVLEAALEQKVRSLTARASAVKDPVASREAAFKAWRTIRANHRRESAKGTVPLLEFMGKEIPLPLGVRGGTYVLHAPLIKASKLTYVSKGGVGKELSDGWVINYAIGCTFGCKFCYVDSIHKKFSFTRAGDIVYNPWGFYFSVPENLDKLIDETDWGRWKGKEVMLSSTHDPYLPQLREWTRKILETALAAGVKFCIQTRSPLVERDFDLIQRYQRLVRLQVSVSTLNNKLARIVEPRVVPPQRRLEVLRKAKEMGLRTGVILAPIFPSVKVRPDVLEDMSEMAQELAEIRPDYIYGESVHLRGINMAYLEDALGEPMKIDGFDKPMEKIFHAALARHGLKGRWWPEH
jgi:DNA repair photolyase